MKTDSVGKRIKHLREKNSLEAQKLAHDLQVGKSTLSNWENDRRTPDLETLKNIANYFNVSTDYLLFGDEADNKNFNDYFGFILKNSNRILGHEGIAYLNNVTDTEKEYFNTGVKKALNLFKELAEGKDPKDLKYLFEDIQNHKNNFLGKKNKLIIENDFAKVPVLKTLNSTLPPYRAENIIDYKYLHKDELQLEEEYFYLHIEEDIMIHEGITNKSIVLIKKQDFIESNGDKILVRLDNGKVVLKRAYKKNNLLILQSETDNYYPIVCNYSDIQSGYVKIIGKAIKVETNL